MADVSASDPGHLARYDPLVSISKTLADHNTVAELFLGPAVERSRGV